MSIPVTLVLKGGCAKNYEPDTAISLYKFASLGQNEGLCDYYRNRCDDASLYYIIELRLALGQVKNGFLPF